MRVREENCNMLLLAAVALVSAAVAGGAALLGEPAPPTDQRPVQVADQTAVRVIGPPFVPNTKSNER